MLIINQVNLKGKWVELEVMNQKHHDEFYAVAQDETIWTYNSSKAYGDKFYKWFTNAINNQQRQEHLPFVVRRLTDKKLIGSTRYYDMSVEHRRVTIGYTWYLPEVWGGYVNPECKYLLLSHAFQVMQANRVQFVADARNARSRSAIKKLGAIEEGIMRQHMLLENGYVRDTVVFSITLSEWPNVQENLQNRLTSISA